MPVKEEPRDFSFSYSDLIVITRNLCVAMQRDIADFAVFAVLPANVTALTALCDELEAMPTDIEYEGNAMVKTEEKNALAEQVREQIRFMAARAEAAFGVNTGKYDTFKFEDLTRLSDSQLKDCMRRVIRVADNYKTDLEVYGVTDASLTALTDLCDDFEQALSAQEQANDNRRLASIERARKANEIYRIISNYCNFGKKLYAKSNPANYEDYIIYTSSSPGTLTAPQNLIFNYSSKVLWWDAVDNAVSYQLQWFDGSDYVEIYAGGDDHFAYTPADGLNKFRVRAHNAGGYGPWSEILEQYYFAVLPKAANLQVVQSGTIPTEGELTWDAVPKAFNYKVYQSVDNIGEYAAHWLVIGTVTEPLKSVTLTLGKRNSFKIETNNTYQTSMSDTIFIEV